jgi:signal transduction histidine kinase
MMNKIILVSNRLLMLFCFFISISFSSNAQDELASDKVKAAYIYNFIKHVSWPNEKNKPEYIVGVYGDETFAQLLNRTLSKHTIKNKSVTITLIKDIQAGKKTDLLFVAANRNNELTSIASIIRNSETLLITDNSVDKNNVMINMVNNEDDSAISFEVNKSNIVFERLAMSAELLLLGGTELDVAQLYRATELAMQDMKEREISLNQKLLVQEKQIQSTEKKLKILNQNLKLSAKIADERQTELQKLKVGIELQQRSIKTKEQQLEQVATQLSSAKKDLSNQQNSVLNKEQENQRMAEKISTNRDILNQQLQQIDQQGVQLSKKNEQLEERKERIDQQKFYLILMAVFISLLVIISVLVVFLFIKNTRTTRKLSNTLENLQSMQEQLVQSEKMASLGTLTAGVAHEINTPLGIAVTSTSSALESTQKIREKFESGNLTRTTMATYFSDIEQSSSLNTNALERVIELLNNFKQVAADQVVGEEREVDLVSYIEEVMSTLSAEMKRFRVNYHYSGVSEFIVTTIPGALAQVLTNLVTNALKHAFEGKISGNLTIELLKSEEGKAVLTIKDDGCGMNQHVLDNIFEPFFTTKRNSGGTGLGMNIVYNIISQKLQGTIKIESAPEQGASFNITLPTQLLTS